MALEQYMWLEISACILFLTSEALIHSS